MGLRPWRFESSLRHQDSDGGLRPESQASSAVISRLNTPVSAESLLERNLGGRRPIWYLKAHQENRYIGDIPALEYR